MSDDGITPAAVDLKDSESALIVSWQDGSHSRVGYRPLRIACRCALCIEEMTGKQLLDPDSVPADVGIEGCKEVGLYGLQFEWTDGHTTGIYTWKRIKELGS